jgi:disease resistance protein RPM1
MLSEQMAEALVVVVSKICSTLTEEATKAAIRKLSEKVTNLRELPGKIDDIGSELNMMNNVIKQIGTPSPTDEIVKGWIAEVRILAHRVEDVIDKYSYYSLKLEEENAVKKIFSKAYYVTIFTEIAGEIAQVEKKIESVAKRKERWLHPSQLIANPLADIERKKSQDYLLDVVPDDLVGIEENRILLTQWLYSNEQSGKVITVSGMGGLGKTTLVGNMYEHEKNNFTAHAWIVVSQTYNVVELLRKLLRKIGGPEQTQVADMDAHDLKEKIKQMLKYSKCLIVLDDVWNQEAYTQMSNAFRSLQACCVIITTRQENVAALADPTRQLKLKPLEHSDAFALFCRKAFCNSIDYKCPHELEKLANNIVDRCQGLPLAIVSMGGLLSALQPVKHVWNETYKKLRNELTNNDQVCAILNLSYYDLPGDLRNCFFYCSLFPEDHQFSRESLVRLWVSEGFAMHKEQTTAEEVADRNLRELIQRNMLEVVENDELGRVSTCKMHDLVRDLALAVAKEEKFGFASDFVTMAKMDKSVRRLSTCGWKDKSSPKLKIQLTHLRTLVAVGITAYSPQMLSSILSQSMYLTTLELQDSEITEVPASIGDLFNLRYIGLRRTHVKSLPESIGKLSNLHTLDIKQTKIEKLPRGIVKIKKLRHLLADRYVDEKQSDFRYFMGMQAPKELSNMDELQTLETVEANKDLAEQLRKLMQIRSLWIDNIRSADCENLFTTLSKIPFLSSLLVSASDENEALCLEALKPESENLHRLIIRGCWPDNTLNSPIFHDHGKNLKYLALSWCTLRGDPLQLLAPHVPNLTYLSLNRVSSASILVLSAGCFPQLKTLVLKCMNNVSQLEIRDGALPQIEGLYVVNLPMLNRIPQGIESLCSMKKLWLLRLHQDFRYQWNQYGMQQKMQYVPELRI